VSVFFSITATVVIFLFIARLVFVQGMQGDEYKKQAEGQYVPAVTPIFNRGNIFLKSKTGEEIPIASLEEYYTLAIQPNKVTDVDAMIREFSHLGIVFDEKNVRNRAEKKMIHMKRLLKMSLKNRLMH
jgi:cell division protein FtsI/penicillin-binding protein 2